MYPYITVFGRLLPTYGLFLAAGLIVTYLCARIRAVREGRSAEDLLIVGAVAFGCALLGAKLLYILVTFTPAQLLQLVKEGKIGELLSVGFVFYGGLIGGIFGAFLGARIAGVRLQRFERDIFPVLPVGYAFGRVGCWFSGCCYGKLWGSVRFPVQLLDAGISILVSLFLIFYARKERKPWSIAGMYLAIYGVQRFLLEFLRADEIRRHFGPLSTSQWISVLLLLTCGVILWVTKNRKMET